MAGCAEIRELLGSRLDGDLDGRQVDLVEAHLESCGECAELAAVVEEIAAAGSALAAIEPPQNLADDLRSSPCRLWLGLLFQAVDREISQRNLERLLGHLESCPSCRQAWQDLTLIHQVGDAIAPPRGLVTACIAAPTRKPKSARILNRRLATAAAYALAVLTSLVVGNPVTLARSQAAPAVERVAQQITVEVNEVAEQGRGELRVMMWRLWKWGEQKAEAVRDLVTKDDQTTEDAERETDSEQGELS
jgi:predicted anti-sigma-YlaC factor YlaD